MNCLSKLIIDPDLISADVDVLQLLQSVLTEHPDLIFDDDVLYPQDMHPPKRTRIRNKKRFSTDYKQTSWGELILDPAVKDPSSKLGRLFRRRFRVPYTAFAWICTKCKEHNIFEVKREASVEIPVEIKVLISLRMLGRAEVADTINELSKVSEAHCRSIFNLFIKNFRLKLEKELIYIPTGEELRAIMDDYALLGLPGTVGSVDVTHVFMDKCPSEVSNLCSGKEKKTTLAFEVVVTHRKQIMSISKGEYGSLNDKTISRYDPFVSDIMNGRVLTNVKSSIYDSDGNKMDVYGCHLVCDGGYQKVPGMICPITFRTEMREVFWSEWVESVRKDVECTFGILKQRFRILKNPFQGHSLESLENIFVVCCMIHNILLIVDGGLKTYDWNLAVVDECADDDSDEEGRPNESADRNIVSKKTLITSPPNSVLDELTESNNTFATDRVQPSSNNDVWLQFHSKTKAMVNHFAQSYNRGELHWMKRNDDGSKIFYPVGRANRQTIDIVDRVLVRSFPSQSERDKAITSFKG